MSQIKSGEIPLKNEVSDLNTRYYYKLQQQSRAIIDSSTDGVAVISKAGEILDLNLSMASLVEKDRDELSGMVFFNLFPEFSQEAQKQFIEEVFTSFTTFTYEIKYKNRWISFNASLLQDLYHNIESAVVFARDITETQHVLNGLYSALEANKAYEEFMEQLLNVIPDIIGIQDNEHKVIRYNAAGYRFLNMTHAEVVGKKCFHLLEQREECEFCATSQSYITQKPSSLERFFPDKGIWFDVRSYPVLDNEGRIKYVIEHLRDITRLKEVQIELHKSEERFRELFNFSAGGILLGSREGVIIEVNHTFCQLTGYKKEELIGKHISESIFTSESIASSPFRFDLLNEKKMVISQRELLTSEGKLLTVEMRTRIMPDGTYQSIFHDISDRKRAEKEINRQNAELRMLNSEKDHLFSIIAHDLRSPFTAILGLTQMISDEFDMMNTDELKGILKELHKSATNLYTLLDNLLEWTMVRRNKKPFNPTKILLSDLINYSLQLQYENAKLKSIDIFVDIADDILVFADRNMLEIVVRNLLSNAVKFTRKGGRILVEAQRKDDNFVSVSVKDTGIGMPQEMLDNMFSLSAKNNRKGTRGEPSTGLGLLLCKEFVQKNGGEISVESTEEKGSTFSFILPSYQSDGQNTQER
ncbi:MAG: PAS domain S-box protein [Lentimicrobium sp.]|nr:PAS domain S-box protein [Lentimicrobium sp.]